MRGGGSNDGISLRRRKKIAEPHVEEKTAPQFPEVPGWREVVVSDDLRYEFSDLIDGKKDWSWTGNMPASDVSLEKTYDFFRQHAQRILTSRGHKEISIALVEHRVVEDRVISRELARADYEIGSGMQAIEPLLSLYKLRHSLQFPLGESLHMESLENGDLEIGLRRRAIRDDYTLEDELVGRRTYDPVSEKVEAAEHAAEVEAAVREYEERDQAERHDLLATEQFQEERRNEADQLKQHLLESLGDFKSK